MLIGNYVYCPTSAEEVLGSLQRILENTHLLRFLVRLDLRSISWYHYKIRLIAVVFLMLDPKLCYLRPTCPVLSIDGVRVSPMG